MPEILTVRKLREAIRKVDGDTFVLLHIPNARGSFQSPHMVKLAKVVKMGQGLYKAADLTVKDFGESEEPDKTPLILEAVVIE